MSIIKRAKAQTPPFFKKVRKWGLILATVSGTILAAPVAMPVVLTKVAGYVAVAGAVATAISQTATNNDELQNEETSK